MGRFRRDFHTVIVKQGHFRRNGRLGSYVASRGSGGECSYVAGRRGAAPDLWIFEA